MSTTLPEYNGWTNYMTWAVHLWITNEEGSYDYAREIVAHARRGIDADDQLKAWVDESNPLADSASMYSDVLGYALAWVDWKAISEALAEPADLERWEEARGG